MWTYEQPAPRPVVEFMGELEGAPPEANFLWEGWLPLGHVTVLAGEPGLGKSLLTADLAARLTRGGPWPGGSTLDPNLPFQGPMAVMFLYGEDSASTLHSRLTAAGADIHQIVGLTDVAVHRSTSRLELDRHGQALEQALQEAREQVGDIRLLIIDPLAAFTGRSSIHQPDGARRIMARLATLAQENMMAVIERGSACGCAMTMWR